MSGIKSQQDILDTLKMRFGITGCGVQVILPPKDEHRVLYMIDHIKFHGAMTLEGLHELCNEIAGALDAELYGTVTIDFVSIGEPKTFDMVAEVCL